MSKRIPEVREVGAIRERSDGASWDARDPLADVRERFHMPEGLLYFDGNSLGPLPKAVVPALTQTVEQQWGSDLIASWNHHDWIGLPTRVGARLAPLLGASQAEVVVCDSVSVNLFKLLSAALALRPGRDVLVMQQDHFPTDLYIAQGLSRLLGDRCQLRTARTGDLKEALDDRVAAVCFSHVDFKTGRLEEMAELTTEVQAAGALMVWDLSHSAGALPVRLGECGVDMAVGCGYKFLNGGPGAPSYLFVAERHHEEMLSPLCGWLGHSEPFAFAPHYEPAAGVARFICGTPPILSLAAFDAALHVFDDVDLVTVRRKSVALGELFLGLVMSRCDGLGLELACPRPGEQRGSQVTFRHRDGYAIVQALVGRGVVGDFRAPEFLRFGINPLYQRFVDIWDGAMALGRVLESGEHQLDRFRCRHKVT